MKGTRFVNVRSLLFLIVLWATINVYAATSQEEREQHDYDDREAAHANPPQLDLAAPETTLLMDRVYIVTDQQRQARRISPYQLLGDDESACGRTGSTTGSSESDRDSSCDYNSDSSATSIGSIGHDFQVPPSIRDGGPYHYISFVQLKHRGSWRDRLRLPDTIVLRRSIRNMHRRRIVTGQHVMRINLHRGMVIENKLEDLEGVVTRARRDEMKALDEKRFHVASFRLRGRAMRDFMGRAGLKTDRSDSGSATMNIHALELRVVYVSFRLDAEVVDKVHPGFDDIVRLRWNNQRTLPMLRMPTIHQFQLEVETHIAYSPVAPITLAVYRSNWFSWFDSLPSMTDMYEARHERIVALHQHMRPFLRGFSAIDNKLHDEGMRLFSALEIAAYAQSVNAVHFYRRQLLGEDDSDHEESSISNSPQKLPPTVLLDAACNNNLAVFDYLLRSGSSDPTIGDEKRRLPLHMAAWCNNVAVLRLLIDGKFTALDVEDSAGKTALFYAVENDQHAAARAFLTAGADPDHHANAVTPLCVAATFGRISVLSALIEDPRTKLNARCVDHIVGIGRPKSPLELAAIYGHADVVRALVDHPGVRLGTSSSKNWNRSPLAYSIEKCKTEIAFAILNAAIAREKQVDIDPLVDQETSVHAMVNQRFEMQGWTPLHLATSEQCLQIVQRLLDLGADVDAVATIVAKNGKYKSRRPIHSAVQKGNEEIVRALLKSGARRELADDDDETPYVMSDSMRELLQANVGSDSEMDGSSDDGSSDDRQCDENASAYPLTHWRLTEDEMLALSSAQRCFYDPNQPGEADVSHPDSPQYATSSNFNFAQTGPQNMSPQGLWNSGLVNAPQPPLPHLDLMMAYPGERPFLSPFAYGSRGTTATGTPYFKSSSGTPSDSGILRSRKALGSGSMSGVFAPCKSSGVEDPRDRMAPRADDQVDSSHTYECDVAQGGLHEGRFARLFRQHRRESSTGTRSPFSNLSSPGGSIGLTGISEFDMPSEKGMDGRNPFEGFEAFDEEISSVDNGNEEQANTNQPDMDASEAIDDHSTEDAVSSSSSDEELNAPDHVRRTYSVVRSGTETRGMLSQYEAMLVDAVQSGNALHVSTFLYACKMKLPEFNVSAMRIRLEGGEGGELSLPELAIVGAKEGVGEKQMHAVIEALHDGGAQADSIRLMELAFERKLAELNSALLFMEW